MQKSAKQSSSNAKEKKRKFIILFQIDAHKIYSQQVLWRVILKHQINCYMHVLPKLKLLKLDFSLTSKMKTIIDMLRPKGCTSLGPALSVAMGIVNGSVGSEIVLCTDGAPNGGIGSLSSCEVRPGSHFYIKVGILLILLNYRNPIGKKESIIMLILKSFHIIKY